jgi:molecular chaperone HtpG
VFKLFQAEDVGFAFKPLFPEEERAFADLLSGLNRRLAAHQLEVVLNYFSPHDIPMLYISSQQTQAERELERVAEASNDLFGGILGSLQEEEQAPLAQLYLNFHNEVVQSVFCSGKSEATIASVVEVLYVQALLMGHYPLKQNEVKLMNQGLLSIIKAMK